jgi:hypothetical protein
MPDPRGDHAAMPWEVPPRSHVLDTTYEDGFWADLAERINFAGRVREGCFRIPRREARKFWSDLERTFFTNPRPRGA